MELKLDTLFKSPALRKFLHNLYIDNSIPMKYNAKFKNTSIVKMNRLMIKFFKQPEMIIKPDNNIIPFRFFTKDRNIINGLQYITNKNSKKWIITTHDFGQNKFWSLFFAKPFIELGYNVMTFDFRNHGDNGEASPITLGQLESIDLESAIEWLTINRKPSYIGLYGVGLGAYSINGLYYDKPEFFTENKVKFAICESTYTSVESLVSNYYAQKKNTYSKATIRKIARKSRRVIKAANKEQRVNLYENNLLTKIKDNESNIKKNYVPFFYTNSLLNNIVPAKDSLELNINRDIFKQRQNKDKIVIYDFSQSKLIFKDHFKKNMREIVEFENKIIKNEAATKRVMKSMNLDDEAIENSYEEYNELTTFVFDK